MRVRLFTVDNGDCPYLENRSWISHAFQASVLDEAVYERMLGLGWRRSGCSFYQNLCPGCNECIPIRIPASRFRPSKSQRRVLRKNGDIYIRRERASFKQELFTLYQHYNQVRHKREHAPGKAEFHNFLISSPIRTDLMEYYLGDKLIGAGWVDVLPNGISSIYYIFDPDYSKRSLGTFSVMKEIELCNELGKEWLYLGFYVRESPKMSYKADFKPYQLLTDDEVWTEYSKPE